MQLNVFLGGNFPNEKPLIIVTPKIQHEWIPDPATGEVQNAPGLLNVIELNSETQFQTQYFF